MSNIPEEVENDPTYRRKMLYAWSTMLKDRDDILQELNKELENVDVLRYDRQKIDGLLSRLEERDRILVSSRYMHDLSNATLLDRAIVGVQSFFALRLVSFSQMMLPVISSMTGMACERFGPT